MSNTFFLSKIILSSTHSNISSAFYLYSLLFAYLSVCLAFRIKFFPFVDEQDIKNRIHKFTYIDIALRFNMISTIFTLIFAGFYVVFGTTMLLCCIISLIFGHILTLIPDVVNKYWSKELRSNEGFNSLLSLYSKIMILIFCIMFFTLISLINQHSNILLFIFFFLIEY